MVSLVISNLNLNMYHIRKVGLPTVHHYGEPAVHHYVELIYLYHIS